MTGITVDIQEIGRVIDQARILAKQYRLLTGRPLGITGEVAEYEAARLLNLSLSPARQAGYDATYSENDVPRRVQVKGRCILPGAKPGQRLGRIDLKKKCDEIVLVLLDDDFQPISMYRAQWSAVEAALRAPGSIARNERGALSVSKFKSISEKVWDRNNDA